jgi:carbon monoxide dehydrogenase subunit G
MIIDGEFQVNVSIKRTWDFLTNIQKVASCVPSFEKVEVFDDKSFAITVSQKVGPFSATFETQTSFTEASPPNRLVAFGRGKDTRMGSSFELTNEMNLAEISEKETLVKYKADIKISGRLASVGQSLIKIVAKREVAQVIKLIQEKIGGQLSEKI